MNTAKSDLYCNGIPQNILDSILHFSGFKKGELPFKYLGVPISSKKLSSRDCFLLSERICSRIQSWGARKLSYAGRLTLVNVVLNSLHTYWASIFLLPATVMAKVISICRNYLWDGSEEYHKAPLVSWDKVCQEKSHGGLGIIHCQKWNVSTLGKYVWWIEAKKDHLWVKWVNHLYLKGVDWMEYQPTITASWARRQLCKVKECFKTGYVRGRWNSADGVYTIKHGYSWLSGEHPKVSWAHIGWHRFNVPKWSFVVWLMRHNRLLTLDRLGSLGIVTTGLCFLCGIEKETCTHLFFECGFSSQCPLKMEAWLGWQLTQGKWLRLTRRHGITKFQASVCGAAVHGLIYLIWHCRNICRLEMQVPQPLVLINQVKALLLLRLNSLELGKFNSKDDVWFKSLSRV